MCPRGGEVPAEDTEAQAASKRKDARGASLRREENVECAGLERNLPLEMRMNVDETGAASNLR